MDRRHRLDYSTTSNKAAAIGSGRSLALYQLSSFFHHMCAFSAEPSSGLLPRSTGKKSSAISPLLITQYGRQQAGRGLTVVANRGSGTALKPHSEQRDPAARRPRLFTTYCLLPTSCDPASSARGEYINVIVPRTQPIHLFCL